ncbi:MAG: DUF87 domain-containing protein [Nanoarchaeota archaeon]|nr:DUF87 domain-containing protein [Nanoarchaeota archaeon]
MENTKFSIGKDGEKNIDIDAQKLVTGRTCVIAQSGAGKSYLIAVLCEQMLANDIPFCIIDTEGEYFSLRDKYKTLWVGGKKADINIENTDMKKLAMKVINEGIPLIFDVSDVLDERKYVSDFADNLYEVANELRKPYLLIVEESDRFVPQSKESLKKIEEISRRGRKRGLGLLLATQRPALVSKNVLSQCSNQLIGKLTTENDLQAVNLFFGSRKELEELPELEPGEFFIMGEVARKKIKVKVKERTTKHKGMTPILIPKRLGKISFKDLMIRSEESVQESPEEKSIKIKALEPKINKGEALQKASPKREKRYIFFGPKEDIKFVELQLYPLIRVEYRQREGLLKKTLRKYSFILDGMDGKMVDIERGLKRNKGFDGMIGLNQAEIQILLIVNNGDGIRAGEIREEIKMSLSNIKTILKRLQKKNLIDYSKKTDEYISLADITVPNLKKNYNLEVSDKKLSAKPIKASIKENEIRDVLKAINPKIDISNIDIFYYPIYAVNFERKIINIDGITGKEIN